MNNSLGKQFSEFLSSEDFDAANQIIKKAKSLNYPHVLINFWEDSLAKIERGVRHPLDSAVDPKQDSNELYVKLNKNAKEEFQLNLVNYCTANDINMNQVNKIFEQDKLLDETISFAKIITDNGPFAIAQSLKCINDSFNYSLVEGLKREVEQFSDLFESQETNEGLKAFVEKRKANFRK